MERGAHDEVGTAVLNVGMVERRLSDGQRTSVVRIHDCELIGGNCYCLAGPSGVGKTTALEMLSLAQRPDSVEGMTLLAFGERIDIAEALAAGDMTRLDRLRALHFGYIIQANLLLPFLTVRQNVELSQILADRRDPERVEHMLDMLQMLPLAEAYPGTLSGGQRQRACIARALAHRPRIVLADEPTSAIDAELGRLVIGMLRDYAVAEGAILLVVTHNLQLAAEFNLPQLALRTQVHAGRMQTDISRPDAGSFVVDQPQIPIAGKGGAA